MPIVTPDDVHALQLDVQTEAEGLGDALAKALTDSKVSPFDPIVAQWQRMMDRVQLFLRENPSWINTASQMDRGQQLQRELGPWHARMTSAGVPNVPPMPPQPGAPQDIFGNLSNIAIAIAVIFALKEFAK